MSATHSPVQSALAGGEPAVPPPSPAEIDASCRVPVLFLFFCAALWLLTGSAFALIATLKFHAPGFLADCPWFTYGRVHPAALNSFLYGFAAQAGFGVVLWLICQLGRTRLAFAPGVFIGTLIWNAGVKLGILGILAGESTGFEWLEMPRYASLMLFCASLLIGLAAMQTFSRRGEKSLSLPQWFLLAAVFWFPWIYSSANILLVAQPVRGAVQASVAAWYAGNLSVIWFGFIGLAVIFHFIPQILGRPLHSRPLGIFTFWTLALFGSFGAIPAGAPLPSWLPALSTVAAVLTIVPVAGIALNLRQTIGGDLSTLKGSATGRFLLFGTAAWVIASLATALNSLDFVSVLTGFTWLGPALTQSFIYGFFAMTLFGAIYHIVPRLAGVELSPGLIKAHFWLAALGILLYAVPLALGGLSQGDAMNLHSGAFLDVVLSSLTFIRISTMGDLFMALGHLVLLLNLLGLLVRIGRAAVCATLSGGAKPAEVAS